MTPEFAYFLKVNVAFILLYAFYRLFFYKDTFFKLRRTFLLAFFGVSLLYPLMNIQDWIREVTNHANLFGEHCRGLLSFRAKWLNTFV